MPMLLSLVAFMVAMEFYRLVGYMIILLFFSAVLLACAFGYDYGVLVLFILIGSHLGKFF